MKQVTFIIADVNNQIVKLRGKSSCSAAGTMSSLFYVLHFVSSEVRQEQCRVEIKVQYLVN